MRLQPKIKANIFQILRENIKNKTLPKQSKVLEKKLNFRGISFYYKLPKNAESIWKDVIDQYEKYKKTVNLPTKLTAINDLKSKIIEPILKMNGLSFLKFAYFDILKKTYTKSDECFMLLIGFTYGILNMWIWKDIAFFLSRKWEKDDLYIAYLNNLNANIETEFKFKNAIDWYPSQDTVIYIESILKRRMQHINDIPTS